MIGVRDSENARKNFADVFAEIVKNYTSQNLFVTAVFDQSAVPLQPSLLQNYPNPFNPTTNFGFRVSSLEFVSLRIFDVLGREVATLVNEVRQAGTYTVRWDASSQPSGVYFYQMRAGGFVETRKLVLTK
jgi:hypothetical protein